MIASIWHTAFWHWVLVHTGSVNEPGPWYGFWSGFGSDIGEITLIGAVLAAARHKNCHVKGCLRLGHPDPEHGYPACRKHHSRRKALGSPEPPKAGEAQFPLGENEEGSSEA